jgi:hypothetical protein
MFVRVPGVGLPSDTPAATEDDVLLLGGLAADGGLNGNLWRYSPADDRWSSAGPPSGAIYRGGWPGLTWRDETGYLYGGWDGVRPLIGLFQVDLLTGHVVRLDADDQDGPGARAQASLVVPADGESLFLFGGLGSNGWTNDAWAFDLRLRRWHQVAPACAQGQCPALGPAAVAAESSTGRLFVVPTQVAAQNPGYWLLSDGRWRSMLTLIAAADAADCDGSGEPDSGLGWACRNAPDWWRAVGAVECDTFTGAPVCLAPDEPAPRTLTTVHGFHDDRFAVGAAAMLYVLKNRQVVPLDVSDPARPRRRPPTHLSDPGREILLHDGILYVATTGGLEAFSLVDPADPDLLWRWPLADGVDDLAAWGNLLVAVGPERFVLLDVRNPAGPEEAGAHRLVRVGGGWWALDPGPEAVDLVAWLFPDRRRVAQFDGRTLVVGDVFDLTALDLAPDGVVERLYSATVLPGQIHEITVTGGFAYSDTVDGYGSVVRIGDGTVDFDGLHTLTGWADGAVVTGAVSYRSTADGIEVAHVP